MRRTNYCSQGIKYINQLNPLQQIAYEIAKKQLKSSFTTEKSIEKVSLNQQVYYYQIYINAESYKILRTLIKEDVEGNSYQQILDAEEGDILFRISKSDVANQEQLNQELSRDASNIYNLSTDYPIKVSLYQVAPPPNSNPEYYLSIIIHHIAFDGWSVDILMRELEEYYNYYLNKKHGIESRLLLPDLTIQYKDFALWQRSYLSGERLETQLSYWRDKLNGYESLNLITDNSRPSQIDYKGRDIDFVLNKDVSNSLRELAKDLKVSLYSVLLSAYYLMLRAYSNQDDIVIGTPIANRHYPQIENLIGFFVNSLALRATINAKSKIQDFIK